MALSHHLGNRDETPATDRKAAIRDARRLDYVAFTHRVPFTLDAYRLGFAPGIREDYDVRYTDTPNLALPVVFLDNHFEDADPDRFRTVFERVRPKIANVGDAFTQQDARDFRQLARDLREEYPDVELVVTPKCRAAFDVLPDWIILGYPLGGETATGRADHAPSDYSELDDWRGRRVHLLGGSPQRQWRTIQKLTTPTLTGTDPANIVGVDYNGFFPMAQLGDVWTPDPPHWWTDHDYQYTLREKVRLSLRNSRTFFEQRGCWPTTTPRETYGPAVLTPDQNRLRDTGQSFQFARLDEPADARESRLHHARALVPDDTGTRHDQRIHLARYQDGTTYAFSHPDARATVERDQNLVHRHGPLVRHTDGGTHIDCL